jgi:uncharacterized DUF497 family protein
MSSSITLAWDDNNVDHLWQSHQVTPDEVEEVLLGIEGQDPQLVQTRDGDYHAFLGQTGGGRMLSMVGEFLDGRQLYVFSARDMNEREKRRYRRQ